MIEKIAADQQRRVSEQIRSAAPRVPHRGNVEPLGGSLAQRVLSKSLRAVKRWGVVIQWSKLGQSLLLFSEGSSRQKARPLDFNPSAAEVKAKLEASAVAHARRRAEREA